jgi:hypothetical protein
VARRSDETNLVRQCGRIAAANTSGISQVIDDWCSDTACASLQCLEHLIEITIFLCVAGQMRGDASQIHIVDKSS